MGGHTGEASVAPRCFQGVFHPSILDVSPRVCGCVAMMRSATVKSLQSAQKVSELWKAAPLAGASQEVTAFETEKAEIKLQRTSCLFIEPSVPSCWSRRDVFSEIHLEIAVSRAFTSSHSWAAPSGQLI